MVSDAERYQKAVRVLVNSIFFILLALLIVWFVTVNGSFSQERVQAVCVLVVQLDSFFGATYLGGIFLYGSEIFKKSNQFPRWWSVFFDSFLGFGGSGMFALLGALTGGAPYLFVSMGFLLHGIYFAAAVLLQLHSGFLEKRA
ncbi:hypothetical protein E6H27_04730 [Candidatus Bathyarchaeota archaeon]|nr:MAG: hypothetical protein E6H27_04730 [Candidatus Bathyarchaeota archaeon]